MGRCPLQRAAQSASASVLRKSSAHKPSCPLSLGPRCMLTLVGRGAHTLLRDSVLLTAKRNQTHLRHLLCLLSR